MGINAIADNGSSSDPLETASGSTARASCVPAKTTARIVMRLQSTRPDVRDKGFAKALAAVSPCRDLYTMARGIIPDAYEVGDGVITIIEVADTHPIRAAKAERIAELWDELEEYGWELWVEVYDYMGGMTAKLPGWCYGRGLEIAPPNCMDLTPAALAAHMEAKEIVANLPGWPNAY